MPGTGGDSEERDPAARKEQRRIPGREVSLAAQGEKREKRRAQRGYELMHKLSGKTKQRNAPRGTEERPPERAILEDN